MVLMFFISFSIQIVSRNVSASDILTWFEVHLKLGVNKVVAYTYNLNIGVTKVLQHYEAQKLVEIHPFKLPKISKYMYSQ